MVEEDHQARRLIVVVVAPGEDPLIETDPSESFAYWELVAALNRATEIVKEEEFEQRFAEDEGEDEGDEG